MVTAEAPEPPAAYWTRREEIAALAAGLDAPPAEIDYTAVEHDVWAAVAANLGPLWDAHAASPVLTARDRLGLPVDHIPQLHEVTERLCPLTGFEYRAVAGLIPPDEFFGGLARKRFSSTQQLPFCDAQPELAFSATASLGR